MSAAILPFNPLAVPGHNASPFETIKSEIEDLFEEAKNFCDGEPITTQEMHDAIEKLHDSIHEAGKRAEALRVDEKKPLDDQIAEIQARFHPLIGNTKAGKGKVVLGKEACQSLLTPWRVKIAEEKAEKARLARLEADRAAQAAQDAIRASSGNLAARAEAEEQLIHAKSVERVAKRADRAATNGTGLRTVWSATITDMDKALDWYFGEKPEEFTALVQRLADEDVRKGVRKIAGFDVTESKVAI